MFPGQAVKTGLTLPKVIGGISKTLNVANQIIPLYMQAKPVIQNAKNAFSVAKELMATPTTKKTTVTAKSPKQLTTNTSNTPQKKEATQVEVTSTNRPVFFV